MAKKHLYRVVLASQDEPFVKDVSFTVEAFNVLALFRNERFRYMYMINRRFLGELTILIENIDYERENQKDS